MAAREVVISPSLLDRIPEKRSKEAHNRFRLGIGEWTESSDDADKENTVLPAEKKLKLSTSKQRSVERWHFVSEQQEEELRRKYVAKNTATSTKWALRCCPLARETGAR